jgi:RecB family exonuclease
LPALRVHWIEKYERPRPGFVVTEVEWSLPLAIAGLTLTLKLDRVDALELGGYAIIDYKTGAVDAPCCLVCATAARAAAWLVWTRVQERVPDAGVARGRVREAQGG